MWEAQRVNILVNTKGKCFLCLQNTEEVEEDALEVKLEFQNECQRIPANLVSLLAIARHLKINPSQIISPDVRDDDQSNANCHQDKISNLCVELCNECAPVVTRLSNLCLELEVLKMKVDHQLRSCYEALEISERDAELVRKLRGLLSRDQLDLAETLRERIRTECSSELNGLLPKVIVVKTGVEEILEFSASDEEPPGIENSSPPSSPTPEPFSPRPQDNNSRAMSTDKVSFQCNLCSCTFHLRTGLIRHRRRNHCLAQPQLSTPAFQLTCKLCSLDFLTNAAYSRHIKFECPHIAPEVAHLNPEDHYYCSLCQVRIRVSETRRHKIQNHVDTLLTSYKLPHLTLEEFKEYCDHVFQVELLLCRKTKDPEGNATLECSICSKGYSSHYTAHIHLFLEHKELMGKKLAELQKSTGLQEIRSTKLPSTKFRGVGGGGGNVKKPPGLKKRSLEEDALAHTEWVAGGSSTAHLPNKYKMVICNLCHPPRQMKLRDLRRHKMRSHVESFLTGHKAPHVSMADFKLYCQQAFKQEADSCQREYDEAGKPGRKCRNCSRRVSDEEYLNRHFFLEHREYMVERIEEIQGSFSVEEIRAMVEESAAEKNWNCLKCGVGFGLESSLRRHMKYSCKFGPKVPKQDHKCEICGKGFSYPFDLNRHMERMHSGPRANRRKRRLGGQEMTSVEADVTQVESNGSAEYVFAQEDAVFAGDAEMASNDDTEIEMKMTVPDDMHILP